MSNPIDIDFETFYSKKLKYGLKTSIAEQYCNSPHFDPYLLSVYDGAESWVGHPKDFNWAALSGRTCLAHNRYFDNSVWNRLAELGVCPKPDFKEFHCTANLTAYLCNRRPLDGAVEHLMGIKISKESRADANGKHWPKDFSEAERAAMLKYAQEDPIHGWNLWDKFSHRWPTVERRLSNLTINQGMHGIQIDTELLESFIIQSHEMKMNTEQQIPWIKDAEEEEWDDFNAKPTSTKCIAEQCRRDGIPCPPVKKEDEEAFELWEATYGPSRPWIACLSAWRSINKLYKTFITMKARLRADGTMPFALLYFGAHTGRWAATAQVNLQNQRKKPVFCNERGLMETDERRSDAAMAVKEESGKWPDWVRYAIDFRHLILPRPGKKMIVSDLSQIEPRVLAWLVGDTAMLDLLRSGMSIYEAHARATMGWTGGNLKKENPGMYALAKARILGLGYGCGWEKFITMAQSLAGIDITTDDPEFVNVRDPITGNEKQVSGYGTNSKRIVKEFREANEPVTDLWKNLDGNMKMSVGSDFVMKLPNGREMRYERVRGERRIEKDKETGLPKTKSVYTVGIGHRRHLTYGGKLCENLVQAVARDVFGEHLVAMEDRGWGNLFSVHDEAILEVDQDVTAKDVEREMSKCPEWLAGCPIGAEAHEVDRYQK